MRECVYHASMGCWLQGVIHNEFPLCNLNKADWVSLPLTYTLRGRKFRAVSFHEILTLFEAFIPKSFASLKGCSYPSHYSRFSSRKACWRARKTWPFALSLRRVLETADQHVCVFVCPR